MFVIPVAVAFLEYFTPYKMIFYNVPRSIVHIENDGYYYTIEVSPPMGITDRCNYPFQHTHVLTKANPSEKRSNALVYFTMEPASSFGSISFLNTFSIHSHNCDLLECSTPKIYYVGDDHQIYDYSTNQSFANTPPYLLHYHRLLLLNVRRAKTTESNTRGDAQFIQATPNSSKRRPIHPSDAQRLQATNSKKNRSRKSYIAASTKVTRSPNRTKIA